MKKLSFIIPLLFLFVFRVNSQTTVFSYQAIPSRSPQNCFFNTSPGPTNPVTIGGYSHYGIVGGVDYTGNEFVLPTNASGGGSGFGIYYQFNQNYKYKIIVTARASATTLQLLWATNQYRTSTPSSCSPGFPNIITQSANTTSSISNLTGTFTDYTLIENYTPSAANINYLLFSDYNTAGSIGAVEIRTVTIIATPLCKPPTITGVTALGNNQVQISFTAPSFNLAVNNYNVVLSEIGYIFIGAFPMPVVKSSYGFSNVGTSSPITVTAPKAGTYQVTMQSACNNNETANSNSVGVTIN